MALFLGFMEFPPFAFAKYVKSCVLRRLRECKLSVAERLGEFSMGKPGIVIDTPGFGQRVIHKIVSDYTGTLSCRGKLVPGARSRLRRLMKLVDIEVITADSYGTARQQLKGIAVPNMLKRKRHDVEKRDFVRRFELRHVAAFGNGNNDRLLLQAVKIGGGIAITVDNGEGCALDAILHANIFIVGAANALDLLLNPTACKATLRF
jgi:soluble P-type ATPase